jgi:hypothetical protein
MKKLYRITLVEKNCDWQQSFFVIAESDGAASAAALKEFNARRAEFRGPKRWVRNMDFLGQECYGEEDLYEYPTPLIFAEE